MSFTNRNKTGHASGIFYFCTNQQPPQRGGAVLKPVLVGLKWLWAFQLPRAFFKSSLANWSPILLHLENNKEDSQIDHELLCANKNGQAFLFQFIKKKLF